MCVGAPGENCVEHTFDSAWCSAKELFSAGYIKDTTVDQAAILEHFDVPSG